MKFKERMGIFIGVLILLLCVNMINLILPNQRVLGFAISLFVGIEVGILVAYKKEWLIMHENIFFRLTHVNKLWTYQKLGQFLMESCRFVLKCSHALSSLVFLFVIILHMEMFFSFFINSFWLPAYIMVTCALGSSGAFILKMLAYQKDSIFKWRMLFFDALPLYAFLIPILFMIAMIHICIIEAWEFSQWLPVTLGIVIGGLSALAITGLSVEYGIILKSISFGVIIGCITGELTYVLAYYDRETTLYIEFFGSLGACVLRIVL